MLFSCSRNIYYKSLYWILVIVPRSQTRISVVSKILFWNVPACPNQTTTTMLSCVNLERRSHTSTQFLKTPTLVPRGRKTKNELVGKKWRLKKPLFPTRFSTTKNKKQKPNRLNPTWTNDHVLILRYKVNQHQRYTSILTMEIDTSTKVQIAKTAHKVKGCLDGWKGEKTDKGVTNAPVVIVDLIGVGGLGVAIAAIVLASGGLLLDVVGSFLTFFAPYMIYQKVRNSWRTSSKCCRYFSFFLCIIIQILI